MNLDSKGKGAPGWHAGAGSGPPLVPEPLQITPSSSSSLAATFGGREVQRLDRKSCEADARPASPGRPDGTPPRPLRTPCLASPEMARFHALSKRLGQLPLARKAAQDEEDGSDGRMRRQLARVITQAQLLAQDESSLSDCCRRLLALEDCRPAMAGLVAAVIALERRAPDMPHGERERLLDEIVSSALRSAPDSGVEALAMGLFEALCEVFEGTGHWMPQAAPFVRMVLERLLAPDSSPAAMRLLQAFTTRMLLLVPPAQLPRFLAQVLDQPFLSVQERSDRLRALVAGVADKTTPAPNDACLRQFLGHVLQAHYPEANRIVLAAELARRRHLWQRACQPGMLEPAAFGRLLLARTGVGLEDGKAGSAGKLRAGSSTDTGDTGAVSLTTRSTDMECGSPATPVLPAIETKSGPARSAAAGVGRAAQVRSLALSLMEGAEGLLAREVLGVLRAIQGAQDAGPAREALRKRILEIAPDALPQTNVAMACGWGLAVGVDAMDDEAFAEVRHAFELPASPDGTAWMDTGSLQIGLAAARDMHGLLPQWLADPQPRCQAVQVCREARGPLADDRFRADLMRLAEMDLEPGEAALWLEELVRQFNGVDFGFLATASLFLLGYVQALAMDGALPDEALEPMAAHAARIHEVAYLTVLRRYDQCLWMTDATERDALRAMAQGALQFLAEEDKAYRDPACPLPPSEVLLDALGEHMRGLRSAVRQLGGPVVEPVVGRSSSLVSSSDLSVPTTS